MNIVSTIKETFADGPGIRYSIYTAGCIHHCKGCHNPQTWDPNIGVPYTEKLDEIIEDIKKNPMLSGITISGGDPFLYPKDLYNLLLVLKTHFPDKNIWVFTGYTLEELAERAEQGKNFILLALGLIDTLVDGPFIESLKIEGEFRGSSNQRFIENPLKQLGVKY